VRSEAQTGRSRRIALVARTAADVRDTIIEGESGILAVSPPWFRPRWEASKRRLTWPNGVIATTYTADEPDTLRGPQHDFAWCDELAAWRYPDAWDQLRFGLRLGSNPRCVVTTTPRPTRIIRDLIADPATRVTRGSTYDNRANLAAAFFASIVKKYEGSRLGRQELNAEILDDAPGALWKRDRIDALRVAKCPELRRIVIAIDPAVTSHEGSNETGIIVGGIGSVVNAFGRAEDHGFILDDLSGIYKPHEWAARACQSFVTQRANLIVGEVNNGGEMIEHTIRTVNSRIPFKAVHASRGKRTRAEPVSALYEQGRVHHVGQLPVLEDQLCTWDETAGEPSPDRLDALVWLLHELMVEPEPVHTARLSGHLSI
jgi:phage terminase large subunit-like protein